MKARAKQPIVEARQWDGDMDRMSEWLRANMVLHIHIERDRLNQTRLRVVGPRYTTSLTDGDWLVVHSPSSLSKVTQAEFDESYERAGPVVPMTQAELAS